MEAKDTSGWPILAGSLVRVQERPCSKPWRGWVEAVEHDPKHGVVLHVEPELKGGRRHIAVERMVQVLVVRPTRFQEARRVGAQATQKYATEKLRRRRASSPRRKGS